MSRESSESRAPDAGGPEDFDTFVEARSSRLYRTACLLTGGDTHLAEDLVQETLTRMCMKWDRRHGIGNPAAYAQTILVNRFISAQRRKSSRELPSERVEEPAASDGDTDLRVTLIAALARLPELDRAVLVLRFWEDLSVADTANLLTLNANTVRSRSLRALARLRELLGTDYSEYARR